MHNHYALFQFQIRPVLVRYISSEWIKHDIEDAITNYIYAENLDDQGILDYDEFVKTIMDSFNVEYEIIDFDNYFVED
jgi:hypothetical protein